MALKHMRVAHKLKFSCDMCKSCKAFICRHHRPEVYHDDITTRAPEEEQYVDLYLDTPPCTSFSISGKQLGTAGEGKVLKHSLKYIQRQRPRVAVMENVKNLTPKKFKPVVAGIHACLKKLGYTTYQSTLNAMCYGVPQSRERVFFVSIRNDSKVHKFSWPAALRTRTIESALDPVLPSDRAGRLPKHTRAQELCKTAYKRCLKDKGVNALETPVLVDVDCSSRYATFGVNIARTLTKTRGGSGGPWVSTRGRRTTVSEMLRIQGFVPAQVGWQECGISRTAIGKMAGNHAD